MMLPILLCLVGFLLGAHLLSLAVAWLRCGRDRRGTVPADLPPITVVRPLCGIETFTAETLAASFAIDYPCFELLFCVARATDPVIPLVRAAIAAHPLVPARLLVGDDPISINPKLNNMVKGWREASHPWIAFIDSNVLMPRGFVTRVVSRWDEAPGLVEMHRVATGLVSAPPIGTRPEGFGGHLECAFLNTHEARWQYFVDTFGFGFAQGKTLFYRKSDLDRTQMRDLASEPAEDAATTKMVRRLGLKVRLAPPSPQPLGRRAVAEVWSRQLRWARLRRATFLAAFLPEIISGGAVPALTVALAAVELGWPVVPTLAGYLAVWWGGELLLAAGCRWPLGWQTPLAIVARDVMLPALYIGAFTGRSFTWQGQELKMEEKSRRNTVAAPSLRSGEGL